MTLRQARQLYLSRPEAERGCTANTIVVASPWFHGASRASTGGDVRGPGTSLWRPKTPETWVSLAPIQSGCGPDLLT